MELQDFNPHERITAAEIDLQRRERRGLYASVAAFFAVTAVLIYAWFASTAGERACRTWLENKEPRLESLTIRMVHPWKSGEVTCEDQDSLQYFESSLNTGSSWTPSSNPYYNNYYECEVVFHFSNGTEYQSPGPCQIGSEGISLPLPTELNPPGYYRFQEPMPESWKQVLRALLGMDADPSR